VSSTVLSGIKPFVPEYTRVKYGTGCLLSNVLEYKSAVRIVPRYHITYCMPLPEIKRKVLGWDGVLPVTWELFLGFLVI
jgi:hypothetical protein